MRERVYRTEALILRRSDFGEADRLLLLATPGGKRRVVAKGARKTTSKLAGYLELFTHANLLLAVGRNLDLVTQSQTLHAHASLRESLPRLSCAYYAAELYDRFTEEEDESQQLFELLVAILGALDQSAYPDLVLRAYELRLLHLAGYRPHLHYCAVCGARLSEAAEHFSPSLGGMLCPHDCNADRAALPLSGAAFRLLRYLQTQPLNVVERLHLSAHVRDEAAQVLRAYLRQLLERELKSVAFLDEILRVE
ncbi:DNA repair protein RecO [Candidatus Viridilinea mediisalina]|uniref:DNA repair protein RecO n=1 Tax=Candidatus Viridilinea mediisalina TaxID=2024553 RepID=A0A2A6RPL2_9CHLR|nr:DNA repair protein RecO [Candidatus Viridilinea mediisalina]PDW04808.1 DNA repair protein RecO [Candidatus Viridilinea mediisalina]